MVKLKEFSIVLFGTQVYNPGSVIEGCVVLELSVPQNFKCISIFISGNAHVKWSTSHLTYIGMSPPSKANTEVLVRSEIRLLGNGRDSQQVGAGRYQFPFSFRLPSSLPTSYKQKIYYSWPSNGKCEGCISYSLTATLSQPWKFNRYTLITIYVKDVVSINMAESFSRWTARGSIRMMVETDRGGYLPGESIAFSVNVKNNGNRRIKAVKAVLIQLVVYYGREKRSGTRPSHHERHCIGLLKGPGSGPGGEISWNDRMSIPMNTFPDISNCRVIRLSYILIVEAVVARSGNLLVEMPIVIGTRRYQEQSTMAVTSSIPQRAATNPEFMSFQREQFTTVTSISTHQLTPNMNTGSGYHPLSIGGDQGMREAAFTPRFTPSYYNILEDS